jgi:hypothetical protein
MTTSEYIYSFKEKYRKYQKDQRTAYLKANPYINYRRWKQYYDVPENKIKRLAYQKNFYHTHLDKMLEYRVKNHDRLRKYDKNYKLQKKLERLTLAQSC